MNTRLLTYSLNIYKENFKISLLFSVLIIFAAILPIFFNTTFSSAAVFWNYALPNDLLLAVSELVVMLLFLFAYAFLLCLFVLLVNRELLHLSPQIDFQDMINKYVRRVFGFFVLYTMLIGVIGYFIISLSFNFLAGILSIFLFSLAVLFVPQAIILEKRNILDAIEDSVKFTIENPALTLLVLVIGSFIVAVVLLLEYAVDLITPGLFLGRVGSFLLLSFFLLPFMEILKTYAYMLKFHLIKGPESIL